MSLRATISRTLSRFLTSNGLRDVRRGIAALPRMLGFRRAEIFYFHQLDDPYAHLAAQALADLEQRYRIVVRPFLVPPPDDAAAPERQRLEHWSRRDAGDLARRLALSFPDAKAQPPSDITSDLIIRGHRILTQALTRPGFAAAAVKVGDALWRNDAAALNALAANAASPDQAVARALAQGHALRKKRGHYLGATFYFESEWFWGVDRLHFLEARLKTLNLEHDPGNSFAAPVADITCTVRPRNGARPTLHFYLSFRSPYTCIAVPRVRRLADHYGADLKLRFVLPMVMRGIPVPSAKRLYIMRDAKREATRVGARFGIVVDPLGRATERGLAVLHHAIAEGKGAEFAESFLFGVFADGIDAATDTGLLAIARRAGLTANLVATALRDESWRKIAETNRQEMFDRGIWGVPSFRVNDGPVIWGQDRLWRVEQDLIAATGATP